MMEYLDKEEVNKKLSPWAVIETDDRGYPNLPEKPVDADPVVVRTVLCKFVKQIFGKFSHYL